MTVRFGADWSVQDEYRDLLTLMNDGLGVDTAFIIVTDATRIADPTVSF